MNMKEISNMTHVAWILLHLIIVRLGNIVLMLKISFQRLTPSISVMTVGGERKPISYLSKVQSPPFPCWFNRNR